MFMVNEEKNDPELAFDLAVIGENDPWTYFTTIYFTFQVLINLIYWITGHVFIKLLGTDDERKYSTNVTKI